MRRVLFVILTLASSGCASSTIVRSDVPIELSQASGVTFSALKVVRKDGSLLVTGNIRSARPSRLKGHVDVEGLSNGRAIISASSKVMYFRPLQRTAYFRATITLAQSRPDAVRLSYDPARRHSDD